MTLPGALSRLHPLGVRARGKAFPQTREMHNLPALGDCIPTLPVAAAGTNHSTPQPRPGPLALFCPGPARQDPGAFRARVGRPERCAPQLPSVKWVCACAVTKACVTDACHPGTLQFPPPVRRLMVQKPREAHAQLRWGRLPPHAGEAAPLHPDSTQLSKGGAAHGDGSFTVSAEQEHLLGEHRQPRPHTRQRPVRPRGLRTAKHGSQGFARREDGESQGLVPANKLQCT